VARAALAPLPLVGAAAAPGAALELAAGAWLVASVVLLSGPALVVDVGATGLLVACVGLARLLDRSPPSGSDPPRTV